MKQVYITSINILVYILPKNAFWHQQYRGGYDFFEVYDHRHPDFEAIHGHSLRQFLLRHEGRLPKLQATRVKIDEDSA